MGVVFFLFKRCKWHACQLKLSIFNFATTLVTGTTGILNFIELRRASDLNSTLCRLQQERSKVRSVKCYVILNAQLQVNLSLKNFIFKKLKGKACLIIAVEEYSVSGSQL